MRLLVVEDEPAAAALVAKGLREHAYAVDVAADGVSGLEMASVNDYDLIVLDVLLVRHVRSWTTSAGFFAVALVWCVMMAFSRLYLGSHFASDVIAGLVAGGAWVAICASALEVAARRRAG